jgi:hypothetical protein
MLLEHHSNVDASVAATSVHLTSLFTGAIIAPSSHPTRIW